MQEKTIKSVLRKKIDDWVSHVDNDEIKELIKDNAICTGGAIASMLMGEDVHDFDIYFRTKDATVKIARYYVEKFKEVPPSRFKKDPDKLVNISVRVEEERVKIVVKSQGIAGEEGIDSYQYFEQVQDPSEPAEFVEQVVQDKEDADQKEGKPKYRPVFLTSNAITLSDKVQLVIRFFGSPQKIHENYDFVHCTCSWDSGSGELILPNAALISMLNRRLKYKTSKYPLCSIIRTRKFLKRGWHIDAGQYVKMAWDLNQLNLNDIHILEDQMVGVDSAYFYQVLHLLNEHAKDSEDVDGTYLMEVIDKVFG